MTFLVRSNLSRGDLRLYLSNENGYAQDAASVLWTVFDPSGIQVSGGKLKAVRAQVGEYYAPWFSDVRNGNYSVRWEIQESSNSAPKVVDEPFFIVDPASYESVATIQNTNGIPLPGGLTYLTGTYLGPGDLPLFLFDENRMPQSAYAVFWTIRDAAGNVVNPKTAALQVHTGEYFAPWYANVASGEYSVLWEYAQYSDSPLQSTTMIFSVVNPSSPIASCEQIINSCSGSLFMGSPNTCVSVSTGSCCDIGPSTCIPVPPWYLFDQSQFRPVTMQIPRTIHLALGTLPAAGAFTNQAQYIIPAGIDTITFYLSYQRGAPGGYAHFQLLWGNGVEESHETVITDSAPGQQNMYLQDLVSPTPSDNSLVQFIAYTSIPGGATTVRLLAAEKGVPSTPGNLGITLTAAALD